MLNRTTGICVRLFERLFPERQIFYRSSGKVVFLRLNKPVQLSIAVIALGAMGWVAYASANLILFDRIIAAKDQRAAEMVLAYRELGDELDNTRQRFSSITKELETKHRHLVELVRQRRALERKLSNVARELDTAEARVEGLLTERDSALDHGGKLSRRVSGLAKRLAELKGVEARFDGLTAERDLAREKGRRLTGRVEMLETRLSELKVSQHDLIARIQERTKMNLGELESMIALTGLDVDDLLKDVPASLTGLGGPLVSLSEEAMRAMEFAGADNSFESSVLELEQHLKRWAGLQNVMQRLPISSPLDSFYVASRYGKRRDPFTKKWAMHAGVDLAGSRKSPVWSTAPGRVTFVGRKGPYGKMVEIDHGYGLKTRYGHLRTILVKRGQKIDFRHKVGIIGSTGRSTGRHLHYEIVSDGRSQDPAKFMKAGKYVFKG